MFCRRVAGALVLPTRLDALPRLEPRSCVLLGALLAGAALLLTTPFWLKNWLWYGDPLYPFLYRHFSPRPWTPDSAHLIETVLKPALWRPEGTLWQKLQETLPVL